MVANDPSCCSLCESVHALSGCVLHWGLVEALRNTTSVRVRLVTINQALKDLAPSAGSQDQSSSKFVSRQGESCNYCNQVMN